jgi:L-ascorbate metabolism protein UlaG (beta-lactamase superfamily)
MDIKIGAITVQTVDAYNLRPEGNTKLVHKKGNGVGYVITVESKRIYHAGDTDLIPEMKHIENIDVALLPIGGRDFTMGVNEAVQAAKTIHPKVIIPMHRFESDPQEYKRLVEIDTSIEVLILGIGEIYQF